MRLARANYKCMDQEMLDFLKDLAAVLEKHKGGLTYTTSDDGIHAMLRQDWANKVCIGFPSFGDTTEIRRILEHYRNTKQ